MSRTSSSPTTNNNGILTERGYFSAIKSFLTSTRPTRILEKPATERDVLSYRPFPTHPTTYHVHGINIVLFPNLTVYVNSSTISLILLCLLFFFCGLTFGAMFLAYAAKLFNPWVWVAVKAAGHVTGVPWRGWISKGVGRLDVSVAWHEWVLNSVRCFRFWG